MKTLQTKKTAPYSLEYNDSMDGPSVYIFWDMKHPANQQGPVDVPEHVILEYALRQVSEDCNLEIVSEPQSVIVYDQESGEASQRILLEILS